MAQMHRTDLVGTPVLCRRGEKLGKIDHLLVHGDGEPRWAHVKGILGLQTAVVPLDNAEITDDHVTLIYERDWVKEAPEVSPDGGHLSDEDADRLHAHYGFERVLGLVTEASDEDLQLPRETREAKPPAMEEGPDSPLTQRRRKRAEELGVPTHSHGRDRR